MEVGHRGGALSSGTFLNRSLNIRVSINPDAMQQTVRQQPALLKAMGNPTVMGALGMVAAKMLRNAEQILKRLVAVRKDKKGGGCESPPPVFSINLERLLLLFHLKLVFD